MGGFPKTTYGSEQQTFNTFSVERNPVGSKMVIEDGRTFRFANIGGTAAVNARVFQALVPSANGLTEAVDAIAAGQIDLTGVGSTSAGFAAGLFNDGYVVADDSAQLDPIHQIRSHNEILVGSDVSTFTLRSELVDAIAGGEAISYIENPWRDIIVTPSSGPTGMPCGVIVVAIAANEFGWVATSGPTRVLEDLGNTVTAEGTMVSENVAGAVSVWIPDTDQGAVNTQAAPLGICMNQAVANADKCLVWVRFIE